jgi:hypothetical protein
MTKIKRPSRAVSAPSAKKRTNPVARSLRSGHLRPRVVPSKKTAYQHRSRTPERTQP